LDSHVKIYNFHKQTNKRYAHLIKSIERMYMRENGFEEYRNIKEVMTSSGKYLGYIRHFTFRI